MIMSRYLSLLLVFVAVSLNTFAQPKVTVGQPYQVIDAHSKYYFSHKGQILTLKILKRAIVLQQMNAVTLKFQKTRMHDDFPRDYQIEKITKFRNRFYL